MSHFFITSLADAKKLHLPEINHYTIVTPDISTLEYFELNKIACINIFDLTDEIDLQTLGLNIIKETNDILRLLENYINDYLSFNNPEIVHGYFFFLRILLNLIKSRLLLLSKFIEKINPRKILFISHPESHSIPLYLIDKQHDYWPLLISIVANYYQIPIEKYSIYNNDVKLENNSIFNLKYLIDIINPKSFFPLFNITEKKKKILTIGSIYEFNIIKNNISEYKLDSVILKGDHLYHFRNSFTNVIFKIKSCNIKINDLNQIKSDFIFKNINYKNVLFPFLEEIVRRSYFLDQNIYKYFSNYFSKANVVSIFSGSITNPVLFSVILAGKSMNIPVRTFQHGGNYGYNDIPYFYYTDMKYSDNFFVWGRSVETFFNNKLIGVPSKTKITYTGTCRLTPKNDSLNHKNRFLYVPTAFMGNYLCFDSQNPLDNKYYDFQVKLFSLFEKKKEHLYVKTYPSSWVRYPLADLINERELKFIHLITQGKLIDLLDNYNNIIIDWPSTTLLECLSYSKNIFLILDKQWVRLEQEALRILENETTVLNNIEELDSYISVNAPILNRNRNKKSLFMEKYAHMIPESEYVENIKHVLKNT